MSVLPIGIARVSNLLQAAVATQSIDSTQTQLATIENEMATGKSINTPSDNPASASMIIQLNQTLNMRNGYAANMNAASSMLGETDTTLGNLTTLIQQAQSTASANVGTSVTPDERSAAASVIQSIYDQVLSIANKTYRGQYLFGDNGGQTQPFVEGASGVQYTGTGQTLQNADDSNTVLAYQVDGGSLFGSNTGVVVGVTNVDPRLTGQTQLTDVAGAQNEGIRLGVIQIGDGTTTKNVDLSSARSAADVVNLINAAGVGSVTASISGQGINLTGTPAENISVVDTAGGQTAADLGIATAPGGIGLGATLIGQSVGTRVTPLTSTTDFFNGLSLDNSGITITNGGAAKTVTWAAGASVQQVLNAINSANVGVRASINPAGTGINVTNITQGTNLQIGENGGVSAAQLGIRTFDATTQLSQLNAGAGVQTAGPATPDFQINAKNGATYMVTLNGDQTVQAVLNSINAATGGAVTASLAGNGNGIVLTDSTGGGGNLSVSALNYSTAGAQLGLINSTPGNPLIGTDASGVASNGIFSNLQKLISSLQTNNVAGITAASTGLQTDSQRVTQTQGNTGAVEQELQQRQTQMTQENTATQSFLSTLQDTDMATAITKFQTLQTALQASYQVTAKNLGLSLLNFL